MKWHVFDYQPITKRQKIGLFLPDGRMKENFRLLRS
ncbi:hypothetical protein SAMN06298210_10234 [Prevotellaceae bacterium KH2P17]|nr:hypothetical protein SAMN06298210_10234 [Prevotellaceae bacterium KH2P17]